MLNLHKKIAAFIILYFLAISSNLAIASTNKDAAEVKAAEINWCAAIGNAKGDYKQVLAFYAPDAILLPTFSPDILHNSPEEMGAYFKHLTRLPNIKCEINKTITNIYGNVAINSGVYTFSYLDNKKSLVMPARFSFVYLKTGGRWLIVNHHSSVLPKK